MSVLESWKTLKMGNSYDICGVICGCRENAQSAPAGVRVQRLWCDASRYCRDVPKETLLMKQKKR